MGYKWKIIILISALVIIKNIDLLGKQQVYDVIEPMNCGYINKIKTYCEKNHLEDCLKQIIPDIEQCKKNNTIISDFIIDNNIQTILVFSVIIILLYMK